MQANKPGWNVSARAEDRAGCAALRENNVSSRAGAASPRCLHEGRADRRARPTRREYHVHPLPPAERVVDRFRRPVDGHRLGDRRRRDGDHDHRPAVGAGGVQHRRVHAHPFRLQGGVARRLFRPRGYRHRAARFDRQHYMAGARGVVAGARPSPHGRPSRRHHRRHPLRLGAPEARRPRALADRQDHRAGAGCASSLPTAMVNGRPARIAPYSPHSPRAGGRVSAVGQLADTVESGAARGAGGNRAASLAPALASITTMTARRARMLSLEPSCGCHVSLREEFAILRQRRHPMRRLASASILLALMTTVASAQTPQQAPAAAPRQAAGPAAQIHTSLPAESATVTHWYKQNVYDPADNKIGEIMDVLVDRDGKITALIVGVGGFLGMGEKDVAVPFNSVRTTTKDNNKWYLVMNSTKDALKSAKGFKYDRNAMTWIPEDAPATTGTPAPAAPRQNR